MNSLKLPVSYGEAFDKLSILEIKLKYIQDSRKNDVQIEYDLLLDTLKPLFKSNVLFHYRILKDINETIWKKQDQFRISSSSEEKSNLCMQIIDDNDRRFRVKSKLNKLFESSLIEQKGYIKQKAFYLSHLGLGDILTQLPLIRYLSTIYDSIVIVCFKKYLKNCIHFFADDSSISFYPVDDISDISVNYGFDLEKFYKITNGYDVYLCGQHQFDKEPSDIIVNELPFSFFNDCNILDYSIFWNYFHVPTYLDSVELYSYVKDIPYCFVHNSTSEGNIFSNSFVESFFSISKDSILILNSSENVYPPDHKWYSIAQKFVNIDVAFYKDTLINADYILVTDSVFFCFLLHLPLKTSKCYVISSLTDYSYFYSEEYQKNIDPSLSLPNIKTINTISFQINENEIIVKYLNDENIFNSVTIKKIQGNKIYNVYISSALGRKKTISIEI